MRYYGAAFVERKRENESKGQRWLSNHKVRSLKANVKSFFSVEDDNKTQSSRKNHCLGRAKLGVVWKRLIVWKSHLRTVQASPLSSGFKWFQVVEKVDLMKISPEDSTGQVVLTPQLREEGRETQPLLYLSWSWKYNQWEFFKFLQLSLSKKAIFTWVQIQSIIWVSLADPRELTTISVSVMTNPSQPSEILSLPVAKNENTERQVCECTWVYL